MRTDGDGNFTIKQIYVVITILLLLLSLGYSFALTFQLNPLEKRLDKIEPIVTQNAITSNSILIHIQYVKTEINKLSTQLDKMK